MSKFGQRFRFSDVATFLSVIFVVLLVCGSALAQINISTIRGTVQDQSKAVVPGAEVTITEVNTNLQRSTVSDGTGNYELLDVRPGTYKLTVSLAGFKTFVAEQVILETGQTRRVDAILEVGATSEQVLVQAGAAVISTEGARLESAFDTKKHADTPWVGAEAVLDHSLFITTLPLVQSTGGVWSSSWAGQSSSQAQMGQDGHTNDGGVNQINDILDSEELIVVPVNNTAEFPRIGYMNMVTKSGSNAWHGRLMYWHLNSAFKAREFFESEKAKTLIHTFSAQASGPIIKDKTFFYASANILKVPSKQFYLRSVPTNLMRSGNFTQVGTIRDPLTGQPFAGNIIPDNRISAVSKKVNELYLPAPNRGAASDLGNNYGFTFPFPTDYAIRKDFTQRIDHQVTKDNTLMARFIENWGLYVLPSNYETFAWTRIRPNFHIVIQDTHVFSPKIVNTARVGIYREKVQDGDEVYGVTPFKGDAAVAAIGLQGVNPQGLSAQGFPVMNITGYPALQTQQGGMVQNDHNWGIADNVSWTIGRHMLKFGGEYKPQSRNQDVVKTGTYGNFSFNGSFTGNAYADFLLGLPYTSSRLDQISDRTLKDNEFGIFITDDFKATKRLTLNIGVRWDRFGAATYEDNLVHNWDLATGNIVVPQGMIGKVRPLYPKTINIVEGQVQHNPSLKNISPRLGVAFRVTNDFVIRGGYGTYTETLGRYSRVLGGGPFEITESYTNTIVAGQPLFQFPNPFPGSLGSATVPSQSFTGIPLNTDNGKIHQFNVTVEHQYKEIGLRASYIGSRGRGLNYSIAINKPQASLTPFTQSRRPWPQYTGGSYFRNDGASSYNALSLQAQRRMGALQFNGHWTLTSNYYNTAVLQDPYAPLTWSRVNFTSRQRAVINTSYDLPIGQGRPFLNNIHPVAEQILGGWQLYWIAYFESGFFFSPSFSGSDPSNTNTVGGLPDRIGNGNLQTSQRSINKWFDATAFALPPAGRFGNSGAYILEGPGYHMHHLSLGKNFKVTEAVKFNFMAAFSNLFNHPNFTNPAANISIPGQVGLISNLREGSRARTVEMRARIEW